MDFNAKEFKTVKNPRFVIKPSDNSRKFVNDSLNKKEEIPKMKEIPVTQSPVISETSRASARVYPDSHAKVRSNSKRQLSPVEIKTFNKEPILHKQVFQEPKMQSRDRELEPMLIQTVTKQDTKESLITLQAGTYCGSFTVNEKGLIVAAKNLNLVKRIEVGPGLETSSAQGVSKINILPSLVLTGTPTAPTPDIESNNEQIATTAYVNALIDSKVKEAVEAAVTDVIQATIKAMSQE